MGTYTRLLQADKEKPKRELFGKPSSDVVPPLKKGNPTVKIKKKIKISRNQDINLERNQDIKISRFLEYASPLLDVKPTDQQSFNYPPLAIDELEKLVLDLKGKVRKQNKRPRWSATKTTVYVLAILYVIWDYQVNGEDSLLHKAIFEGR